MASLAAELNRNYLPEKTVVHQRGIGIISYSNFGYA